MAAIHEILEKYWKFSHFRPLQEEIILSVLEGRDTLALLPTGGGKGHSPGTNAMVSIQNCVGSSRALRKTNPRMDWCSAAIWPRGTCSSVHSPGTSGSEAV